MSLIRKELLSKNTSDNLACDFAGCHLTAENYLGGDYYNFFKLTNNKAVFIIGEISGKSTTITPMVAKLNSFFATMLNQSEDKDICRMIRNLNTLVSKKDGSFIALFYGDYCESLA